MVPGPRYRKFGREYELRVLAEAERCERGEVAELLKREGLYDATSSKWRQQQAAGRLEEPVARQLGLWERLWLLQELLNALSGDVVETGSKRSIFELEGVGAVSLPETAA